MCTQRFIEGDNTKTDGIAVDIKALSLAEKDSLLERTLTELQQSKRKLQVEAALERVRTRTMAMQLSEELSAVATVLFQQVKALGVPQWVCGFCIWEIGDTECIWYPGSPDGEILTPGRFPLTEHPVFIIMNESRKRGDELYILEKGGELQADHYRYMMTLPGARGLLQDMLDAGLAIPPSQIDHYANFAYGNLIFITYEHFPEMHDIFKRFAKVFEQTYTRFLDLQKAEASAREAQIEAALERVRTKAMSMQNSNDVGEAIGIVFSELEKLGIAPLRCGIFIIHEETETMEIWTAISTNEGKVGKVSGWLSIHIHPLLKMAFDAWKQKLPFKTYELAGDDLVNYIKAIAANTAHYKMPTQNIRLEKQAVCAFSFTEGALFTFTAEHPDPDTVSVLQKFASVFGLTYRRYLDLKNAEEQARLAIKQASIDRVRAEIASMRSTEDLQRITPLLWHELNALHIPFLRCGVFIMHEETGTTQAFLASPEGKQLGILTINNEETPLTQKAVEHWRKGLVYTEHWDRNQFINWMQSLLKQKQIQSAQTYQGDTMPPESLYLHFIPFKQGMLYVGSPAYLTDEEIELAKSLSDAFAIAYARYEDFRRLEDAKNKIEATLNELKMTQRQLVHSEKMASLGELTAGIAHEIQNPLNFVNNFSEINRDLIADVNLALENARQDEITTLLTDIATNLEKIAYHGKRADSIVKSMLQHSRKSTGKKSLTDINGLIEEYLRLSYHGLRAKNPGFDAEYTTDLDKSIEKISAIPNDIGRVLLNLFNNAFYAVHEKKTKINVAYQPMVTVSTRKKGSFMEISVKDNGNGIPKKILNKIYQPFFTTKPTGEGTGLGLSLSFDIVTKGHGGAMNVHSTEGEGAEFIVQLPLQNNNTSVPA